VSRYAHPRGAALLLGLSAGLTAYAVAYALDAAPFAWLPVEGRWATEAPPGAVAMSYYGLLAVGVAWFGGGVAVGLIPGVRRVLDRPGAARWLRRVALLATAVAIVLPALRECSANAGHAPGHDLNATDQRPLRTGDAGAGQGSGTHRGR
jgi:hypothetical protein